MLIINNIQHVADTAQRPIHCAATSGVVLLPATCLYRDSLYFLQSIRSFRTARTILNFFDDILRTFNRTVVKYFDPPHCGPSNPIFKRTNVPFRVHCSTGSTVVRNNVDHRSRTSTRDWPRIAKQKNNDARDVDVENACSKTYQKNGGRIRDVSQTGIIPVHLLRYYLR